MAPSRPRPRLEGRSICEKSGERQAVLACAHPSPIEALWKEAVMQAGAESGGVTQWGTECEAGEGRRSLYPAGSPGGGVSSLCSGNLSGLPCLQHQLNSGEGGSIKLEKLGKS